MATVGIDSKQTRREGLRLALFLCALLLMVLLGTSAYAQSGAGSIQGSVADASGAVIPNTIVQIENTSTSQLYKSVTNGSGFYSVPGLFAGKYTVLFTAPGMKRYRATVQLLAAQTLVLSPKLSVGSAKQVITVNGNTIQLATYDSGTISNELDNTRINQLPMNGRSLTSLTGMTTPGLEGNGTRADGLMSSAIEYTQDGAPVADRDYGGPAQQVDPDAVEEVKIDTSASGAQYTSPATVIITTKSGTNQLHGSFFETARNNAIGIARSRSNPANFTAPRYIRNEFGGSVGGPIMIPGLYNGKDKSFFFFAYERYSLRSGSYALGTVPTQAMRQGDFSGLVDGSGQLQTIYDPNTTNPITFERQPFANNQIPIGRISPLAKVLNAITPLPTNSANPYLQNNIAYPAANDQTAPTITIRLDHTFDPNNRAYLRYTSYSSNQITPYTTVQQPETVAGAGLPAGISNIVLTSVKQYDAAIGLTHIFSPTLVSQTVLSNTWITTWNNLPIADGNKNFEKTLGLPNNFNEVGMPNIFGPLYEFSGTQRQWGGPQIMTSLDQGFTKTWGRHQMFFGGRYDHERLGIVPDKTPDWIQYGGLGTANYDPATGKNYGAEANTGSSDADFFLGDAYYYSVRLNPPYENWHDQSFSAYFQDDYHVKSNLTINLGLRYEAHPVAVERHNLLNGFDMKTGAIVLGEPIPQLIQDGYTTQAIITNLENLGASFETPAAAGLPPHMVYGNNNIWDPRLGIAYSPFGSGTGTVFRAGFGQYSYPIPLRNYYAPAKTNLPFAANYYQNYTQGNQSPDGQNNYILRSQQTVIAGQNSSDVVDSSSINAIKPGVTEFVLNPHFPPNLVDEFNATIQQPTVGHSVLSLSYVWNKARNLDQFNNFNNAMSNYVWEVKTGTTPPGGQYSSVALNPYNNKTYGSMQRDDRYGWSTYNAMQLNYQRLFQHGFGYQIYYVYSKAMRAGGNTFRDSQIYPYADYAPGMAPSKTYDGLNRFQNYQIDNAIPRNRIAFNGVVDMPFGRGKRFFGGMNKVANEIFGGYQIAFSGNIVSSYFQPSASNWGGDSPYGGGSMSKIHIYKHKYKITDCSSGICQKGYLWFNGFISPLLTNNPCGPNTIYGLPSNYQAYQTPINMDQDGVACVNGHPRVSNRNYLTNNVQVPLLNGTPATVGYSPGPGLNPFSKTYLRGPYNWNADISIFKVFPIKGSTYLRVNMDAFNAFNVQGQTNPSGSTGLQENLSSYNTPRQIQLTARLTF